LWTAGCHRQSQVIVAKATPTPSPEARSVTPQARILGDDLDHYEADPSIMQYARVKKDFAEVEADIGERIEKSARMTGPEKAEAERILAQLRAYRNAEQDRFLRAESAARLREKREAIEEPPKSAANPPQ
jgi:hypothetical protein